MNNLTDENAIKIIVEIMNLQGGFDASKLNLKKLNNCEWLLSNSDVKTSKGAWSADYLGQTYDIDGVDIIAVLMLDDSNYPLDLEIIKLDGSQIILNMNEVKFDFVRSDGKK